MTHDFIICNPSLMKEWNWEKNNKLSLFPDKLSLRSNKKAWWICEKEHEWEATIDYRYGGHGCPFCSNYKLLVGFNDLATTHPEIANEWDFEKNGDITPKDIVAGTNKVFFWICSKCGNSWKASVSGRTSRGSGCPVCSGKVRVTNRMKTIIERNGTIKNPLLLKEWNYPRNGSLTPDQFCSNSSKKVLWKCSKYRKTGFLSLVFFPLLLAAYYSGFYGIFFVQMIGQTDIHCVKRCSFKGILKA